MKCQTLFSGINQKNISKRRLFFFFFFFFFFVVVVFFYDCGTGMCNKVLFR